MGSLQVGGIVSCQIVPASQIYGCFVILVVIGYQEEVMETSQVAFG